MFKVNQKVWCAIYGAGVVEAIRHESATYPVVVVFKNTRPVAYTTDGKYHTEGNVTLFPYPVEIVEAVTKNLCEELKHLRDEVKTLREALKTCPSKPQELKPSIDWSHVSEDFQYLAMDEGGLHHLFAEEPELTESFWVISDIFIYAGHFTSFTPGTCNWRDSLVKRPTEYKE